MLQQWKIKEQIDYLDVLRKGSIGILITLLSGVLFGKENMMIAFVIVLGANIYDKENLRVKPLQKLFKLIVTDLLIVCVAYVASINIWWGILINLIAIFVIIYTLVSPYDQLSYKTFVMVYVFSQYSYISLSQLPNRLLMVFLAMGAIGISTLLHQMHNKAILDPSIGDGWGMVTEQLHNMLQEKYDEALNEQCKMTLNAVAHTIYKAGYRNYFTTKQGKIQFHFYMNISYFNILLEELYSDYRRGDIKKKEVEALARIADIINQYFRRETKREEVLKQLERNIKGREGSYPFGTKIRQVLGVLYKNFEEMEKLNYKKKNTVYGEWERSSLGQLYDEIQNVCNLKSMRVNFAVRLAVILTISLLVAHWLGFYKIIWAIIPIMSATRPYYEDTLKRKYDRLQSNLLACLVVGFVGNMTSTDWVTLGMFIIAFYGVYTFKDYYRISFFLTVISMCLSSFSAGINTLIFYRLSYLIVGIAIVELTARVKPYKMEDGIRELIEKIDRLNSKLEKEAMESFKGVGNEDVIRQTIIHSALLCQQLTMQNKAYQDKKVNEIIHENTEFVIRLGYELLT